MKALIIYYIAHLLDAGLTYYGVTNGVSQEGNPLIAWLIEEFGWMGAFVISKVLLAGGAGWFTYRTCSWVLWPMTAFILGFGVIPWTILILVALWH